MKRKVLQSFTQNLSEMVVGYKLSISDLEKISDLSDGTILMNLINKTASFGDGVLSLEIVPVLRDWLSSQLSNEGLNLNDIKSCVVTVEFKTDRLPTDKSKIVAFDFYNRCILSTDEKEYVGSASVSKMYKRSEGFVN